MEFSSLDFRFFGMNSPETRRAVSLCLNPDRWVRLPQVPKAEQLGKGNPSAQQVVPLPTKERGP
jgi:hypothetical protein